MQVIVHQSVTNFTDWKVAFNAHAKTRCNGDLTVLKIWHKADGNTKAFILMKVIDQQRAKSTSLKSDDNGMVTVSLAYFIKTA